MLWKSITMSAALFMAGEWGTPCLVHFDCRSFHGLACWILADLHQSLVNRSNHPKTRGVVTVPAACILHQPQSGCFSSLACLLRVIALCGRSKDNLLSNMMCINDRAFDQQKLFVAHQIPCLGNLVLMLSRKSRANHSWKSGRETILSMPRNSFGKTSSSANETGRDLPYLLHA